MPLARALEAVKAAYRGQCSWLLAWAQELDLGEIRIVQRANGKEVDITDQTAADYRKRVAALELILAAYEKLHAQNP
jgi:hypothetical protein